MSEVPLHMVAMLVSMRICIRNKLVSLARAPNPQPSTLLPAQHGLATFKFRIIHFTLSVPRTAHRLCLSRLPPTYGHT